MTAVFTGLGAGLERGSANILGGAGQLGGGSLGRAGEGVSVNAATGNLVLTNRDEFLVGRGLDINISRTYNSLAEWANGYDDGDNGDHWQQSTTRRVFGLAGTQDTVGSTIKRQGADGSIITYSWNAGEAAYISTDGAGAHDQLAKIGASWVWTDGSSQFTEIYGAYGTDNWRISQQKDTDGYKLTFIYSADKLDKVTSANGEWVQYVWSGNNISQITTGYTDLATSTAQTLVRTRYVYDAQNRLSQVVTDLSPEDGSIADNVKYVTTYTYKNTTGNQIATISQTDGSLLSINYESTAATARVTSLTQTAASGDTRVTSLVYGTGSTTVTDPTGQETVLYHDTAGQLTRITAPAAFAGAAAQNVYFTYNANGDVLTVENADNGITTYTYDASGNVLTVTDPLGNLVTRTYDAKNSKLTETMTGSDASGASVSHTTRFAYDAENHLRYMVSAEGYVTEYRYDTYGQLQFTVEYPEHSYTIGATALTDTTMDAWRDGLADRSSTKITYYAYDARGNHNQVFNYGFATAAGAGSTAESYSRTYFTYDQAGNLLARYNQSELTETFVYDGMGRLIGSTDLAGGTTSIVFTDNLNKTVVTTADGGVSTSTYNKAGELISLVQSGSLALTGTSTYQYDKNGQLRIATDATGNKAYYVYDNAGRKVADINHLGEITEYRYDAAGRVTASISYAALADPADLTALANPDNSLEMTDLRPAASADDIWSWSIYDTAGQLTQSIDGTGGRASFSYDASGRLIQTVAYAAKLTTAQLNGLKSAAQTVPALPAVVAADAVSRTFYDRDGRLIGSLDGEGFVTEIVYDKAGQKIQEIAYAAATTANRVTGTFTQLRAGSAPTSAANRESLYVYDGQGLLRYSIDAQGNPTSYAYSLSGRLTSTITYAGTITTTDYTYDNIKTLVAAIAVEATDRESWAVYNTAGQLAYSVDATNGVTAYTYDNMAQVIKTVQYDNIRNSPSLPTIAQMDAWAALTAQADDPANRITRNYYNGKGELEFTVDAEGYKTRFDYDASGRNISTSRWPNAITVTDATTIAQVAAAAAGTAAVTTYTYDTAGRLFTSTDAEGVVTRYEYNALGQQLNVYSAYGTADQSRSYYLYDAAGRVKSEYHAYGETEQTLTQYTYDAFGNVTTVIDPRNKTTSFTYDELGQMLTQTDAAGGVTSYVYNGFGQAVQVTDPNGNASYNYYDSLGRLIKSRDAESYVTETSYDGLGNVASVKRFYNKTTSAISLVTPPTVTANAAKDAVTSFEYDKLGRVTKSIDAEGFFETYTYNAFGQRVTSVAKSSTSSTVAGGTTTYAYDKRGLLISETLPIKSYNSAGTASTAFIANTFTYDARGNRLTMTEAAGLPEERTTTYVYDKNDRLKETIGQTFQGLTPHEYLAYDARGNVTRTTDAAGAKTFFFYDDLGRKTVEINALGTYTAYTYDKNGNVTEARVYETAVTLPTDGGSEEEAPAAPAGASRITTFTYDNINQMLTSSVTGATTGYWNGSSWASATTAIVTAYQYDANGNVVKMTDPNGNATWSYYDNSGRKTSQVDGERYRTDWTYDSEGNVLSERRYLNQAATPTSTTTPPAVTADGTLDRITNFTYDKVGNRLTEQRMNVLIHDGSGAQTSADATISYLYNGLGQVTRKTESTGDQVNYLYDAGGRLTEEQRADFTSHQSATVTPEVDYFYDGLGNLSRTVAAGAGDAAARVTTYSYSGGKLETMTDAEGFVHRYKYDIVGRATHDYYTRVKSDGTNAVAYEGTITSYDLLGRVADQWQATSTNQTSWTADGPIASTRYNAIGEVEKVGMNAATVTEANRVWQQQNKYDAAGRVWASNAGDGVWKYFGYDKNGNQTIAITSAGSDLTNKTFAQALALVGNADTNGTYTIYDKRGQALSGVEKGRDLSATVTNQTLTSSRSYNAFGEVISETDALGNTTNYSYNTMGRLIKKEAPTVSVTAEDGAVSSVRPTENYYYDVSGRLVASRDANGNLTRLTLLAGTGYDGGQALVTQELHADGGIKQTKYDIHGDARTLIDELSRSTIQSFDLMGRVTQITKPGGLITHYTYDGLGQRLTEWNNVLGSGNKQTTDYDTQGRVISTRAFGGDVTSISYTWDGTIDNSGMSLTDIGGWTATTTYANSKTLTEQTDLFGRAISKNDLGGNVISFTYDKAARLTTQAIDNLVGSDGTIGYTYYNTGLVKGQTGTGGTAVYKYDALGQRTYESLVKSSLTLKDATIVYDALGRMTSYDQAATTATPAIEILYKYDAQGNVRNVTTTKPGMDQNGSTSGSYSATRWNRYDSMNRLVTADGALIGGAIVRGAEGTDHLYNAAGERVQSTQNGQQMSQRLWFLNNIYGADYWADNHQAIIDQWDANGQTGQISQQYYYFLGTRITLYNYDAGGQLETVQVAESEIQSSPYSAWISPPGFTVPTAPAAGVGVIAEYDYDAMGRLIEQEDFQGGTVYHRELTYNAKNQINVETVNSLQPSGTLTAVNSYGYGSGSTYALGQAVTVTTKNYLNGNDANAPDTSTTNSYVWRDSAIQSLTSFDPDTSTSAGGTHSSSFAYNAAGHLTTVTISDGDPRSIAYKTDETGQILQRLETGSAAPGNVRDIYTRFGSAELGRMGNNGTLNTDYKTSLVNRTNGVADQGFQFGATQATTVEGDFSQGNDQINSYSAQAQNSSYTVRSGDTLFSIASAVWGDGNLWYKLAEANGLSGNQPLAAGRQLHIPHNVTRSTFNADTFKAYDPSKALGDTSPTTPTPPKQGGKCGVFGQILLVAIAVAVAIALPELFPALAPAAFGGGVGGFVVSGAIAGAAGSIASQGVGLATGIQDKFSFKGVALSALSGAVGGGLKGVGELGKLGKLGSLSKAASALGGEGFVGGALRGGLGSAISQGVGVATGLQSKFSFAGVAAAAIGGGVISEVGSHLGLASLSDPSSGLSAGNIAGHTLAGAAGAIANAATRSALTGTSFGDNVMRALPDTIGSTIGNVIAGAVSGGGTGSSARPHVSGVETAAAGGGAVGLVPPNAPRGKVRYSDAPRTAEEARSYARSWKPFVDDPLYRDVAPEWIAFYEDAALKLSPVALETSVVTEYSDLSVGYVDYTDQIASAGVALQSLVSAGTSIFNPGAYDDGTRNTIYPTYGVTQQFLLGDGSSFTGTPNELGQHQRYQTAMAISTRINLQQNNPAGTIFAGVGGLLGAGPDTQALLFGAGSIIDIAGRGKAVGPIRPTRIGPTFNQEPIGYLPGFSTSYTRPSGFRSGVRDAVWNRAVSNSRDGLVRDPLTGVPLGRNQAWDMGHRPGLEFRTIAKRAEAVGMSRQSFLDQHNKPDHYRPELPSSNRGHQGELKFGF